MKKIIFIIAILSLVILTACIQDECKGDDTCYFDKAIELDDEFYCSNIKNPAIRKSCVSEIAISRQDLMLCKSINSSTCFLTIAKINLDSEVCKEIEDVYWHDTCLKNLAVNTSNSNLCKDVLSDDNRDECYMDLAKQLNQTNLCYFIVDSRNRDVCIARRAIASKNSNDCYNIKDPMIRSLCYYRIAVSTGKEKICDSIPSSMVKKDCKEALSKQE